MPALGIGVFDVSDDRRASGAEDIKVVLPVTFLFKGSNEPLTRAVLLNRVRYVVHRCARPVGGLRLPIVNVTHSAFDVPWRVWRGMLC